MHLKTRKGFTIVEAMLSVALVSMAQMYRVSHEVESANAEDAKELGKKLAQIMIAMDKRILLDGHVAQDGDWNKSWGNTTSFTDGMINQELIGFTNPVCGNSASGWRPKITDNNTLALVECNLLNDERFPFGFTVQAERKSIDTSNNHIIGDWSFTLFHTNNTDFNENFKYYAPIRQEAELYDALRMTGRHEVSYVNRSSGATINSLSDCYSAKSNCGIKFKYTNSKTAEASEDNYVRVDGSTAFVGDLYFETTAGVAETCYRYQGSGYVDVPCGFEFDAASGGVALSVNDITANNYNLIYEQGGIPVITYCDKLGSEDVTPCGLSLVSDGVSVEAEAYLDKLYTGEIMFEAAESAEEIYVRKAFGDTSNYMSYSHNGVEYHEAGMPVQKITFGSEMNVDASTGDLKMIGGDVNVNGTNSIELNSINSTVIKSGSGGVKLSKSSGQPSGVSTDFGAASVGLVSTKAFAYQGIKVMSFDTVNAGGTVAKRTCPSLDGKTAPNIEAKTFPNGGYYTHLKSDYCKTKDSNRPSSKGKFLTFNVNPPTITAKNGTGSQPWRNATEITAKTTWSGGIQCEPNTDTAVSYQVDSAGASWKPRFWFWHHSGKTQERTDVSMKIVQFCDYSK